jgi:hypothetical protein
MKRLSEHLLSSLLAIMATATIASAATFDGTKPLACEALQGHDCTPLQASCKRLEAQSDDEKLIIDVAKRIVRSPYRTEPLPIEHVSSNERSLLLQGSTPEIVWNAAVRHASGDFTITIADREGAYVVFGKCRVATASAK